MSHLLLGKIYYLHTVNVTAMFLNERLNSVFRYVLLPLVDLSRKKGYNDSFLLLNNVED